MKTTLRKAIQDQEGAALVLTLVLLMIGGLIMAPLFGHIGTGHIAGQVHEVRMEQLYAADAGVEDAVWRMQSGEISSPVACEDPEEWSYNVTINGETVDIRVEFVGDEVFRVISTTTGEDSATVVESYVFWGSHWRDLLNYGVIALHGDINIDGTSKLDSHPVPNNTHIYAHGGITMGGAKSAVYGTATATGSISDPNNGITGTKTEYASTLTFALPDTSLYYGMASRGQLIEGDLEITSSRTLGPARINGNLYLRSHAVVTLGGPVWVNGEILTDGGSVIIGEGPIIGTGRVYVAGRAEPGTDKMPVVISTADHQEMGLDYAIAFAGNSDTYMVLYAPNGHVDISGSGAVNGAIIGKSVTIRIAATCTAVYDLEVVERVRAKSIRVLTWEVDTQ
jgi:hypothetical protein